MTVRTPERPAIYPYSSNYIGCILLKDHSEPRFPRLAAQLIKRKNDRLHFAACAAVNMKLGQTIS